MTDSSKSHDQGHKSTKNPSGSHKTTSKNHEQGGVEKSGNHSGKSTSKK